MDPEQRRKIVLEYFRDVEERGAGSESDYSDLDHEYGADPIVDEL